MNITEQTKPSIKLNEMSAPASLTTNANSIQAGENASHSNITAKSTQQSNKYSPARRLAARQTLRLAIPNKAAEAPTTTSSLMHKQSSSQLPPATILKCSPPAQSHNQAMETPLIKTTSPLESHNLYNVLLQNHQKERNVGVSGKFLTLHQPTINLNSSAASDICNKKELFAFTKEISPAGRNQSPIFEEIATQLLPLDDISTAKTTTTTTSLSPNRLFSLSPSSLRSYGNMTDFPDSSSSGVVSPAATFIENFHKKNGTTTTTTTGIVGSNSSSSSNYSSNSSSSNIHSPSMTAGIGGNSSISSPTFNGGGVSGTVTTGPNGLSSTMGRHLNSSSSSSSSSRLKETSSTSQQVSSSSTTTRVEKKSRLHHITSSSSSSSQSSSSTSTELKAAALKRDMNEFKNSMSEINDLALGRNSGGNVTPSLTGSNTTLNHHHHHQPPSINDLSNLSSLNSSDAINQLKKKIRSSLENIVDDNIQPNIKFPDDEDEIHLDLVEATNPLAVNGLNSSNVTVDTVKFEEKRCKTESKKKIVTDGFSSEHATSNLAESKRLQAGDIDYQEAKAAAATRNRMEVDGIKAEQNAAVIHEALSLRAGDVTQQASNNVAAASIKVQSDTFSADKKAISQSQQSQTMTSNGIISQEKHVSSASQSNYTMTHKGVSSSGSSMISSHMSSANGQFFRLSDFKMDDLMSLSGASGQKDIEQAIVKYSNMLTSWVNSLRERKASTEETSYLDKINEVIRRAWEVPTHGHELGYSLCDSLRKSGGLDLLMHNCVKGDMQIKFSSAKLLEQCLTTENRSHVVDNGLDKVVNVACVCTKNSSTEYSRVGTGILEHLFKHSEGTCSDVIKLGGLDAVLFECRTSDVETLRHCASALANLSLYGGAENQEAMILRKVPMWLFPLAFHTDDNIKYYACLAIAVLVANKEIEAEVLKSGCLDLVEPFVTSHDPSEFAKSNLAHAHGQSKHWLERLVPVLSSNREEARSLAAFHFCMEAGIKREQGNTEIFREIGAIEALKTVASCPNAIASKFAAQALRLIGETVPHKLSQQVPLWSVEDVQEWVKQIGFGQFVKQFQESQVDGDLLLKLNEDNLRNDIGIANGILVKRFERELQNLKRMADYSSKDIAKLHHFLAEIGPEYCTYTYSMVNAGIDKTSLPHINEDMLIAECGIKNSIHRLRILNSVKTLENALVSSTDDNVIKTLDVFVSYRRSNGSQLASLLKVHLQLRGFSVFIDVERLEAGKFDNGLLNSIRQAKNFVLVLTPHALERCIDDKDCKDWVHREIVAALNANCNIIPIIDQFDWPEAECLPEDMRSICHFNGVTWIHDYQDACIDKLERFMRGEKNIDRIIGMTPGTPGTAVTYQRMHSNDSEYSVGGSNAGSTTGSIGNGTAVNSGASATSHHGNRYRTSSTPGISQQRFGNLMSSTGKVGSIGSQLSMYGRGSKRNIMTPYRTQHITGQQRVVPMGGSMQNVSPLTYRPPRRSSAVSITAQKAQKANSNYRSHSVDGLLDNKDPDTGDQRIAEAAALVTAGSMALTNASSTSTLQPAEDFKGSIASLTDLQGKNAIETVTKRQKSTNLPPINPQHRKSRSLDHFLDEQTLATIVAPPSPTDGTQSMHNLAVAVTPEILPTTTTNTLPSPCLILTRDTKSLTPERVATLRSNILNRQSPEGISSAEDEQEDNQNNLIKSKNAPTTTTTPITMKSQTRAAAHLHRGNSTASTNSRVAKDTANHSLGGATAAVNNQQVNPNNKTIFNRTMKKVRSLMKKP